MDSVQHSAVAPSRSRLSRTFAKLLRVRALAGVAPIDAVQKVKSRENTRDSNLVNGNHDHTPEKHEEKKVALAALLAKTFASISSIKAAYAELQLAQFPYDADGAQAADQLVVSELKHLSDLKQCYRKKQLDSAATGETLLLAEIKEQRSVAKTYEVTCKKLESELKVKESEVAFLAEKLEEIRRESRLLEKRLNSSGPLPMLDHLHLSGGLNAAHFIPLLRHTIRSIRSFVTLMTREMQSAGWNLDAAASMVQPGVGYWKREHKCFAFESFVCREMFDSFHCPNFSLPNECSSMDQKNGRRLFFERFNELKPWRAKQYLADKPKSTFAKFCRAKYSRMVHPKMESSFFGNLDQRNLVNSANFPETSFFTAFSEMARRVWLLHCMAFSFDPAVSIFQVCRGCGFNEVYMESLVDEAFSRGEGEGPKGEGTYVAFTAVPGFVIGKAVIQCQVYPAPP